ncbi:MAG: hypothetical protein ACJAR2_003309, partial [Ilumatobacter sp.]
MLVVDDHLQFGQLGSGHRRETPGQVRHLEHVRMAENRI